MDASTIRDLRTLGLCLAVAACAGKDGAAGATGPQGAQGPQGPAGAANVIYSAWFTPPSYTVNTVSGLKNFDAVQPAPKITQAVLDSGVVLVYGRLSGYIPQLWPTNQVGQLPILINFTSGTSTLTDTWSAYTTVGSLRINMVNSANIYSGLNPVDSFRYVIIPPGVPASSDRGTAGSVFTREQLRAMSYDQVVRVFHIPVN